MAAKRRQLLLASVLNTIREMKEPKGSTMKDITTFIKSRTCMTGPRRHIGVRIRKVMKQALNGGILQLVNGRFKIDRNFVENDITLLTETADTAAPAHQRRRKRRKIGKDRHLKSGKKRRKYPRGSRRGHRRPGLLLRRKPVARFRRRPKRPAVTSRNNPAMRAQSPSVKAGRSGRRKRQQSYRLKMTKTKVVGQKAKGGGQKRAARQRVRQWNNSCPWPAEVLEETSVTKTSKD